MSRIFIAGATGVLGRSLVPLLVQRGHSVVGMTRSNAKRQLLEQMGARPVVADALDPDAVGRAISEAAPDVVMHQLTALSDLRNFRNFDAAFAANARMRGEGTDILLSASRAAGVHTFIAQSFAGFLISRTGKSILTEQDALDPEPPTPFRRAFRADRHLEQVVTTASWTRGIVLRYGGFYGPGTSLSRNPPGSQSEMVRRRQFPVVGSGGGIWSFIHIDDAAAATVAALEHGQRGIYHITDDEPATVAEWLPFLAHALGGKPPVHVPKWLGRLLAGPAAVIMMTEAHGASNRKARTELGWTPKYPTWREGFRHGLG
jgi:nucleoside-diphosphate-sugar epimerase